MWCVKNLTVDLELICSFLRGDNLFSSKTKTNLSLLRGDDLQQTARDVDTVSLQRERMIFF